MSATSPISKNSSLDQLHKEYESRAETARKYARANFIFDLHDADTHYLKLLIAREEAYFNYKKAEVNDDAFFNHRYAPVICHKIQQFKNRLISIAGVGAL